MICRNTYICDVNIGRYNIVYELMLCMVYYTPINLLIMTMVKVIMKLNDFAYGYVKQC